MMRVLTFSVLILNLFSIRFFSPEKIYLEGTSLSNSNEPKLLKLLFFYQKLQVL